MGRGEGEGGGGGGRGGEVGVRRGVGGEEGGEEVWGEEVWRWWGEGCGGVGWGGG